MEIFVNKSEAPAKSQPQTTANKELANLIYNFVKIPLKWKKISERFSSLKGDGFFKAFQRMICRTSGM